LEAEALGGLGMVADDIAEYDDAERRHEERQRIAGLIGDVHGVAKSRHNIGSIALKRGQVQRGRELLQEMLQTWERLGQSTHEAYAMIDLARSYRMERQFDRAKDLLERAVAILDATRNDEGKPYAFVEQGQVALAEGDYALALDRFTAAFTVFRALRLHDYYMASSIEGVARVAIATGNDRDGLTLAAFATAWRQTARIRRSPVDQEALDRDIREAGKRIGRAEATAQQRRGAAISIDETQAISLSLTIPLSISRTRTDPDELLPGDLRSLSAREREVLCAIAEGLTDRQIGQRLGISTATVRTLVNRILAKVAQNAANRTRAAVYAATRGMCAAD
jgi:DNA-binding NarL/FixJ family response regulator